MAWSTILCFQDTPNAARYKVAEARSLFPSIPFLAEHRRFSILHQIVTRMIATSLDAALQFSSVDVDVLDAHERTPLHWAAARGDRVAVATLLRQGANPDALDNIKQGPLRSSLKAADPACTRLLIQGGATLEMRDKWQQTSLRAAIYTTDAVAFSVVLLDAGADVNARCEQGNTALLEAVSSSHLPCVKVLLNYMADMSLGNNYGECPLQKAIVENHHDILEALLQCPRFTFKLPECSGTTVLHLAAEHGDVETLRLLASRSDGSEIDTQSRDKDGRTAVEIARKRMKCTAKQFDVEKSAHESGWDAAFYTLVNCFIALKCLKEVH
jgi:ankyrin repeat protein